MRKLDGSYRVLLLEFNELVPHLLDRFIEQGELPNFQRFYRESAVFTTMSDETEAPNLEPWIQWYSLHTGLPFREHKIGLEELKASENGSLGSNLSLQDPR